MIGVRRGAIIIRDLLPPVMIGQGTQVAVILAALVEAVKVPVKRTNHLQSLSHQLKNHLPSSSRMNLVISPLSPIKTMTFISSPILFRHCPDKATYTASYHSSKATILFLARKPHPMC